MTELELYKFIHKNDLECHWEGKGLFLWVWGPHLPELAKLLGIENEDEVTGILTSEGEIVLDMVEHCEHHDINPLNISEEEFDWDKYGSLADEWREAYND